MPWNVVLEFAARSLCQREQERDWKYKGQAEGEEAGPGPGGWIRRPSWGLRKADGSPAGRGNEGEAGAP